MTAITCCVKDPFKVCGFKHPRERERLKDRDILTHMLRTSTHIQKVLFFVCKAKPLIPVIEVKFRTTTGFPCSEILYINSTTHQ